MLERDAAYEVSQFLLPEPFVAAASEADDDLAWALAVASFSEVLKESPFAMRSRLTAIEADCDRANREAPELRFRPDRAEFVALFENGPTRAPTVVAWGVAVRTPRSTPVARQPPQA